MDAPRFRKLAAYMSRLLGAHALGLVSLFGGVLILWPLSTLGPPLHGRWYMVDDLLLALMPVPAIAAVTLMHRDYGWRGAFWALPAAIGVLLMTAVFRALLLAAAGHMF